MKSSQTQHGLSMTNPSAKVVLWLKEAVYPLSDKFRRELGLTKILREFGETSRDESDFTRTPTALNEDDVNW